MDATATAPGPALTELDQAAADYATKQAAAEAAYVRVCAAVRAAYQEGHVTKAELVTRSGLARQTVFRAIAGER